MTRQESNTAKAKKYGGSYQILLRNPFLSSVCNPFTQEHPKPPPTPTKSRFSLSALRMEGNQTHAHRTPPAAAFSTLRHHAPRRTNPHRAPPGTERRTEQGRDTPPTRIGGKGCFTPSQILAAFSWQFSRNFPRKAPRNFHKGRGFRGLVSEITEKTIF